jgi:hypothetical protein
VFSYSFEGNDGELSETKTYNASFQFYNRMTVNHNRFLVSKTNRCTEFQFYWYYYCTCLGQPFCPSSGVLSHILALVHYMQLWWPFATRSRMELAAGPFHPTSSSKRSQLHKRYQSRYTAKNSWWLAERLPETCRVIIQIKLEISASVGFIHKASLHVCYNSLFSMYHSTIRCRMCRLW